MLIAAIAGGRFAARGSTPRVGASGPIPDRKEVTMTSIRHWLFRATAIPVALAAVTAAATTGDPLPDVDVSLERRPGGVVQQVKTDPQGNFSFGAVAEGDYVITIKPAAKPEPRRAGSAVNVAAPATTAKSFFESRSNTVRAAGGNPASLALPVHVGGSDRASGVMQSDGVQRLRVNTSGGHIRGQVTSQ
jgi:hypothetical protein